tara:strand:- start:1231 stop:2178 length:948 start_codon:yes stop_codon:yes gene_type:complete
MRSAINAASIAKERNLPLPVFQPIGLHFRVHHWFRTDLYIEQIEPVQVPYNPDKEAREKLLQGIWVEPPEDLVINLRDELRNKLAPISRDAPDWQTYRAWQLLAHLDANNKNNTLKSYKEEVLATREIREKIRKIDSEKLIETATEASKILHSYDLDGRTVNLDMKINTKSNILKGIFGLLIMSLFAPLSLTSTGIQAFLAWFMGNKTDEGIDARTSYHMIATIISPLTFWPIISIIIFILISKIIYAIPIIIFPFYLIISILVFHLSNVLFLQGYDLWTDFRISQRRRVLSKSKEGQNLTILINHILLGLGALK